MLKAEGLVDEDNNPNMETFGLYATALGLENEMPLGTNEEMLQALVDHAEFIRDTIVGLAHSCKICNELGNILGSLEESLPTCGGPGCTLSNQVG